MKTNLDQTEGAQALGRPGAQGGTGGGILRADALRLAGEVIGHLQAEPASCEHIEVWDDLGLPSVARVKEITLRCVPIVRPLWDKNDNPIGKENCQYRRVQELIRSQVLAHRHEGREVCSLTWQRLSYKGFPVEIRCIFKSAWDGLRGMVAGLEFSVAGLPVAGSSEAES